MKKIILIIALIISSLGITGCSNEFLNAPQPTDLITEQVAFDSKEAINAVMSGIIRNARGPFQYVSVYNLSTVFFARTIKGNDFIQANSGGLFNDDYQYNDREPAHSRPVFTWTFFYQLANRLTLFIEGVKTSKADLTQQERNDFLGQGYAFRAFCYFQLSLEFQNTYSYNPDLGAVPIYKEPSLTGRPLSTMKEVYQFILSDLDNAVNLSSNNRINKSYLNKSVAYAIQAQVYQVTGDWVKAEQAAHNAYGGDPSAVLNASQYKEGFNDADATEWLWGLIQSDEQNTDLGAAPFAFMDFVSPISSKSTYVNSNFISLFSNTDVRKLFTKMSENDWRSYTTTKFKYELGSDMPLIRYPEMILIEAEALYHQGKMSEAHNLLFALQKNRDPEAILSGNAGPALLEEILVERRKELYGENGIEWFDAKRLRRGINRTPNHRVVINLTPDDKRFFLKIPQREIDANPYIDPFVNNGK
ncbi:hypothetical protein ACM46_07070 [Chryseobacterium angstadtii]|uniref:Carbohydrate-binding protein SusD n=1 Tax=Chryseobacterium angstadtii TaxID=558151 RepID=A0A0J7II16_9FLAO|nr:RagB/SusD family nutrient uptake outer membrane protein [Chryseobacterium angstadtii]KMQ65629.1 hypothetical protein ACM46_07070 [Chryseobacterium angstadtii]